MMIRLSRYFISILLFLPIPHRAEASEAAEALLALLNPVNNLSANFSQTSIDKSGKQLQQQEGHFSVQKTGEFVWFVDPPYEQQITSNGKFIYIYDPDLEQLTIKPLDKKSQMIPLLLFSRDAREIMQEYLVSETAPDTFTLESKSSASLFDHLVIYFANGVPGQLEIVDSLQQVTRVSFEKIAINQTLDPKIFSYAIPAGVDVIDER